MDHAVTGHAPAGSPAWAGRLSALLGAGLGLATLHHAWRLGRALQLGLRTARATQAFEVCPPQPRGRLLLLGDSTGVGVGAGGPRATLAGLLAAECPQIEIVNRSRNGARVADALDMLATLRADGERFDLGLLLLGGNDALRLTPLPQLAGQARTLLQQLPAVAQRSVWLGCADIGGSPVLPAPLAWAMRWRTGRTVALLRRQAQAHGTAFLDFFEPADGDWHARAAGTCFAADGLHPNAEGYRHCFESLQRLDVLPPRWRRPAGTDPGALPCPTCPK